MARSLSITNRKYSKLQAYCLLRRQNIQPDLEARRKDNRGRNNKVSTSSVLQRRQSSDSFRGKLKKVSEKRRIGLYGLKKKFMNSNLY